jgi:hypothetical protein
MKQTANRQLQRVLDGLDWQLDLLRTVMDRLDFRLFSLRAISYYIHQDKERASVDRSLITNVRYC